MQSVDLLLPAGGGRWPKGPGAKVVLCQNVGELPEAKDYFAFMDYNVRQLARALGRSG